MSLNWTTYTVTIIFRDRLVGGIPIIPAGADRAGAYEKWARGQDLEHADAHELGEKLADDPGMPVAAEDVEGKMTGFRRDPRGELYIEARQVKAMLRESAQRLGILKTKRGARQVIQHDIHVRSTNGDQRLFLACSEPDGVESRPISVITRQGPRTSLKRFEFVLFPKLTFEVRVLAGGVGDAIIGWQEIKDMLELGSELGLGADRSQGEGTFDVEAVE